MIYVWQDYPRKHYVLATGEEFFNWNDCENFVKRTNSIPYWKCEWGDRISKEKFLKSFGNEEKI